MKVITTILDECYTPEEATEILNYSVRHVQSIWYSATNKLINIPWVSAYERELYKIESCAEE